jgi:Na+-driven multidrug efflux pump
MSRYYGEKNTQALCEIRKLAYAFAIFLALVGCAVMFIGSGSIGTLFGSSAQVQADISKTIPIFLVSIPFVAITRITTASFYATEKSVLSYILTFIEPVFMLIFMLILPPLFGGQLMIWWSTVLARILTATLALTLTKYAHKLDLAT